MRMAELQCFLSDQISDIVTMLAEGGVDVNATCKTLYKSKLYQVTIANSTSEFNGHTRLVNALEMAFILLSSLCNVLPPRRLYESLRLDGILTRCGCEATEESAIVKLSYASHFALHWTLSVFVRNPDVALGQSLI